MEIKVTKEPTDGFERQIGRIEKAELGWEGDRRVFGFNIGFVFPGSAQATGWIGLPPDTVKFLDALLKAAGCSRWDSLKHKMVIVRRDQPRGFIRGFEPLMQGEDGITFGDFWPEEEKP